MSVDVAVGVFEGKVVARWQEPVTEITFDPQNAYTVAHALANAAVEAYLGKKKNAHDIQVVDGQLAQIKMVVTDMQRDMMVATVASIIKTFVDQKKSPAYIAMHCVDAVLRETAR